MKTIRLLAAGLAVLAAFAAPAYAFSVEIPADQWISGVGSFIVTVVIPLAVTLVLGAARSLPYGIGTKLKRDQVEQLLKWSVEFGIAKALEAAPEKITVEVKSAISAAALNYAIKRAPRWLQEWMGGPDAIREMIEARINSALSDHGLPIKPE